VLLNAAGTGSHAPGGQASAWVQRFAGLIAPGGRVLDVACGSGRHAVWLAAQGYAVMGVDRNAEALRGLPAGIETLQADLESAPWPLPGRPFDAVVVTNYLWRPLWPDLLNALAPGGVLLYETFALGNQRYGKPSRPDFLLQPGELLRVCAGLRVVAFEEGLEAAPARCVQRIAAVHPSHGDTDASDYPLRAAAGTAVPAR
jgi:SAM-dependent methyltransferase